jgi:hypothetical protein
MTNKIVQVVSPLDAASSGGNATDGNFAQEAGGNLAAINIAAGSVSAATGSQSDDAYTGTGSSSIVGLLKGIYAAVKTSGSGGGTVITDPSGNTTLTLSNYATETGGNLQITATQTSAINTAIGAQADAAYTGSGSASLMAVIKGVYNKISSTLNIRAISSSTDSITTVPSGTQAVSAQALPLPAGAATETGNLATIAAQATAINAGQGAGATGITMPAGGTGIMGWLSGIYAKLSGTIQVSGTFWQATQPVSVSNLPLPSGAAMETGNLASINTAIGAVGDSAYAGTGSATTVALLKGVYAKLGTTLSTRALNSATDSITTVPSGTQAVSVQSLPLPTGAAVESGGNLDAIKNVLGTQSDASYTGSGSASQASVLKGIYLALKGTLLTRNLTAATDTVSVQGGNTVALKTDGSATTQPVSVQSLPLPAGAAQENGNLASILIQASAAATTLAAIEVATQDNAAASDTIVTELQGASGALASTASNTGALLTPAQASAASLADIDTSTAALVSPTNAIKTSTAAAATSLANIDASTAATATSTASLAGNTSSTATSVAAVASATGTTTDKAFGTAGGVSTVVGLLKAIQSAISGVLNTRALSSSTDSIAATVSSLPLPTGAATESGNLATIAANTGTISTNSGTQASSAATTATNTNTLVTSTGTNADTAYTGSGNGSIISLLKGVYSKLASSLNIRTLTASDVVTANIGSTNGLALDSTIQNLITAVESTVGISGTLWVDQSVSPPAYYVRKETVNEGTGGVTITWEKPDGATANPTVANLTMLNDEKSFTTNSTIYQVQTSGTGYTTGDTLINFIGFDTSTTPPLVSYNYWLNAGPSGNIGTVLSAPPNAAHITRSQTITAAALPLPTNAAQESGGNLAAVATATGAQADSAYTGVGGASVVSILKGVYAAIKGTLNIRALSSATDSVAVQGGNATAVKVDGSAVTQPISAAALPLPSGAATETGNLATIATSNSAISTATGTQADTAYSGGASATVISGLKGIYNAIKGTISIRALSSGTDSVTTVPSGTQAVSATSLPLPTGAATETGNLASIATSNATIATAQGNAATGVTIPSGGAGILGWLSGIYNKLNTSVSVTGTFYQATQPVSATTLPLPTGAASETGNLATVATQTTNTATTTGAITDAAYSGSGSGSVVALLKGVYAKLAGTLNTRTLSSGTDSITVVPSGTQAISATSLPLPTGAALESGGNLASIATTNSAVSTAAGAVADTAYTGTGSGSMISVLKGIYSKVANSLNIRALSSATDSITTVPSGTQAISASALPLPSGAATETGNLASIAASTASVATATGAQSDTAWTGSGASSVVGLLKAIYNHQTGGASGNATNYSIETGGNLDAINASTAATSAGVGATSDAVYAGSGSASSVSVLKGIYAKVASALNIRALSSGTDSITVVPSGTQAVSATSLPLPTGAATETGNLATIAGAQGTSATGVSQMTGGAGILGWLSAIYSKLSGTVSVSAASLPLPSGAATETGNLASIATNTASTNTNVTAVSTATGTTGDSAYAGTGASTVVGALKGIYAAIKGTLNTRALTSGTDSITTVPSGTQAVSAVSLPLPSGAATETGNLATVVTNTGAVSTATGAVADTAYAGSGSGSVIAVLKGIYSKLAGTLNTRALASGTDSITTVPSGTQAVSVVSLPLPSGAAQESGGNLATIATAQGTSATGVTQLSGGAGILGWLSGIYSKLNGTIAVSGTFYQATQPVSAASLPLPSGAATETGNLATINTSTAAVSTATGTTADSAYAGSGSATVVAALKGLYTKLGSTLSISATALPLPTGAAQESGGNLASIATSNSAVSTATGTQADTAYTGTGNGTVISILKSLYSKLSGTLSIRALTSGTDSVTIVPSGTQAISAASLPLPSGAATESGNLATVATQATAINTATGAQADTAWTGTGNGSVIAVLKSIYNKVAGTLSIRALTAATDTVTIQGGNATAVKVDGSAVTQPVSGTITANIGTTNGLALDSSVQALITAIKATVGLDSTIWVDNTVNPAVYYVRRETVNEGTGVISVAWETPTGANASPTTANLTAVGNTNLSVQSVNYTATAALASNYAIGDSLLHVYGIDTQTTPASVAFSIWFNATSGVVLSAAPTAGNYTQASQNVTATALPLPSNAAQETGGNLAAVSTATGTQADAAYAGSGSGSVIAVLKGLYAKLTGTIAVSAASLPLPSGAAIETGNLATIASTNTTVANAQGTSATGVNQLSGGAGILGWLSGIYSKLSGTIAVSATSLPLPTGAAQETGGNLATTATNTTAISSATGTTADAAYAGSGSSSVIAALKGIYSAIKGTISIRALTSGTDSVTTVPSGTQAISATALPLPSGAATETGNLATIATNTGTVATAQGTSATGVTQPTGGAGILGWLSGIYNKLNTSVAVTAASLPLPTGAASETGNLATIATAQGAAGTGITAPTGGSGILGFLSGIYKALINTISVNYADVSTTSGSISASAGSVAVNTAGMGSAVITLSGTWVASLNIQGLAADGATWVTLPASSSIGGAFTTTALTTNGSYRVMDLAGYKQVRVYAASYTSGTVTVGVNASVAMGAQEVTQFNAANLQATVQGTVSVSGSVAVTGAFYQATQPVSATALPLPSNAAQETGGNLATVATQTTGTNTAVTAINTATGTQADAAYAGSGNSSVIAALKGIYNAIKGTLSIRALTSGTDSITVVPSGTQAISAASLPLPSGAATETGNLATTATNTTAISTASGTTADAAYTGAGSASIVAVLKGVYSKLAGTVAISAASLPLPTGAATETGNLATTTTQVSAINTATGAQADAAYAGSGSSSVIAALKGIYAAVKGTLAIRALTSGTDSITTVPSGTQAVSVASLPLPSGAAQETGNIATLTSTTGTTADSAYAGSGNASVVSILKGIYTKTGGGTSMTNYALETGGNLATIVTNQGTSGTGITQPTGGAGILGWLSGIYSKLSTTLAVAFADNTTTAGTIVAASGAVTVSTAGMSSANVQISGTWVANLLIQGLSADGSTWLTLPSASTLGGVFSSSAITANGSYRVLDIGSYKQIRLYANTYTSGTVTASINASSGVNAQEVVQLNAANLNVTATVNNTVTTTVSSLPSLPAGANAIGSVSVSNFPATQAVSAASLPLPSGAATESGNLATIATQTSGVNTATGTQADAAYAGSGSGSVIAILKGLYSKLSGSIAVTGTFYQATQPVSAASLPLPTGAATETGNLATIATAQGTSGTSITQPTGGAGILGWLSGIYNKLNTSVAVTGTFWQATQPVSAASLPLPSGAATESGNLATINTSNTAISTATGTTADAAYAGSGNTTLVGALKGIYAKLAGTVAVTGTFYQATQPVSAASLPLPTGAATETGNLATVASAQGTSATGVTQLSGGAGILGWLSGIYSKLSGTIAVSGTFYQATQPVSAASLPLPTGAAQETGNLATIATAQGTGATGVTMPTGGAGILGWLSSIYNKLNTSVAVTGTFYQATQPVSAASLPLPSGAATESGNLASISTVQGTTADTAYAGSGSATVVAILKGIYTKTGTGGSSSSASVGTTGSAIPASADYLGFNSGGNLTGVSLTSALPVQPGTSAVFPVSATALPLPTGAATETGNLASIATSNTAISTATGAQADAAYAGSGSSSIIAALKGIYAAVKGTLSIRALTSGTDSITVVPSGTQAVSAASLPLPSGAATETGNLATTATQTTAVNAATGTQADAAYAGSGNASVVSILKGIYTKTSSGGSGGGNAAAGTIGSAIPTSADLSGFSNAGTLTAVSLTSGLPVQQQTGSSFAVTDTATTAISTATGTAADAAYTGTGTATEIAALKGLYSQLAASQAVQQELQSETALLLSMILDKMPRIDSTGRMNVNQVDQASTSVMMTGTAAAAAALTITLPAVTGMFHYITSIEITLYNSAARTGAAAPVLVTTTNLTNSPVFTFSTAGAIGVTDRYQQTYPIPLKSTAVSTATTIVCPATTSILWRVNVTYFTAP